MKTKTAVKLGIPALLAIVAILAFFAPLEPTSTSVETQTETSTKVAETVTGSNQFWVE